MKRILILYAKYGGGHLSAANSIQSYFEENYPNDTVTECIDCMEYINKFISDVTTSAYKNITKNAPKLWKKIYYGSRKGLLSHISNGANIIMAKKLYKLIDTFSPDIIISTHPFSTQMTCYLKKHKNLKCTLATIMTDFAPHEQWLVGKEFNDYIFVSNTTMKQTLIDIYKIPESKIFTTGIPLSRKFSGPFDDNETVQTYNLDKEKQLILFFGGGEFGLGKERTIKILESLTRYLDRYQIVAISGRNEKMNQKFMQLYNKIGNNDLHVLKYTNDVPALMHLSSLVVTKPGGLTISESLASNLPILIINPIPGQEEENAEFIEKSGSAVWLKNSDNIDNIISELLTNETKLQEMKEKTKTVAKPNSTKEICETIYSC